MSHNQIPDSFTIHLVHFAGFWGGGKLKGGNAVRLKVWRLNIGNFPQKNIVSFDHCRGANLD